jgi:AraC-like DNA-binding protein
MKPILRKIDTGPDHSFSVREDIYPYLYNYWHYHPELELTLIRKGRGLRLVGDSIERFGDGDLILLGSNLPHLWKSDAVYFQHLPDLHIEAIAVHFLEDFWGKQMIALPEFRTIRELFQKAKRGIKITGKTKQQLIPLMESMLKVKQATRLGTLINMLQIIASSNNCSFLASVGFASSFDQEHADKINAIYAYTLNNFQKKISINSAAREANLSPHSFCRYFKSRTRKTYGRFVLEVRIGYACKLLIENKMNISQIAYACGFNNISNFNRQFKGLIKKTPLQYVKMYKNRD